MLRRVGWLAFTAGFLLPTSLQPVLLVLSLAAVPAAFNRPQPAPINAATARPDGPLNATE